MVKKFCDPTAANGYPAWSASPSWGVPFDGDGAVGLKTKSTASATLSIDFAGVSAVAGNSISIAGLTLTCGTYTAGGLFFTAGSGAALAANIAQCVNACNSLIPNAVAPGWLVNNPLKDVLFARNNAGFFEMMTFAGSVSYNANVLFQMVNGSVTGLAASYQFANGVSGCWGYLLNPATLLTSLRSYWAYGLWGSGYLLAGAISAGDNHVIRGGKVIATAANSGGVSQVFRTLGTAAGAVTFTIDDGTEYPADAGLNARIVLEPTFDQDTRAANYFSTPTGASADSNIRILAKRYSDGTSNLVLQVSAAGGSVSVATAPGLYAEYADIFTRLSTSSAAASFASHNNAVTQSNRAAYYRCRMYQATTAPFIVGPVTNYYGLLCDWIECEFANSGLAYAQSGATYKTAPSASLGVINTALSTTSSKVDVALDNCKFTGFAANSILAVGVVAATNVLNVRLRNNDYQNVTLLNPILAKGGWNPLSYISAFSSYGKAEYLRDTSAGFEEWNASRSFPVGTATLLDGTPWSVHILPSTTANNATVSTPYEGGRMVKRYTSGMADVQRTIRCEVAISDQVTWTAKDISLVVEYQATDLSRISLTTFDANAGALNPSGASWSAYGGGTAEVGGKVKYPLDNSLHNKFYLSVLTPVGKNIAQGSLITAFLRIGATVLSPVGLFEDPELVVI